MDNSLLSSDLSSENCPLTFCTNMIIDTIYLIRATAETQEGLQPEYMNKFLICFMMME